MACAYTRTCWSSRWCSLVSVGVAGCQTQDRLQKFSRRPLLLRHGSLRSVSRARRRLVVTILVVVVLGIVVPVAGLPGGAGLPRSVWWPYLMRDPRTRVGGDGFWGSAPCLRRSCPVLLLAPDRCRVAYERVAGSRVGRWPIASATRSALEAAARELETSSAGASGGVTWGSLTCCVPVLGSSSSRCHCLP